MRFKKGNRVRIKSLDWYYENRDKIDQVDCGSTCFVPPMVTFCGQMVTISSILPTLEVYRIEEDDSEFNWTDEMIERLVERNGKTYPYKIGDRVVLKGRNRCATITDLKYDSFGNLSYYINIDNDKDNSIVYPTDLLLPYDKLMEEEKPLNKSRQITDFEYEGLVYILPNGYQFVDENGNVINSSKIVLEKKKKEYPKTYEECVILLGLGVLNELKHCNLSYIYKKDLIVSYQKLLICRDAYWKIAGEEIELSKPWTPDWTDQESPKYCITSIKDQVEASKRYYIMNTILAFPTEEMRDTFYENFKELIENCKELL